MKLRDEVPTGRPGWWMVGGGGGVVGLAIGVRLRGVVLAPMPLHASVVRHRRVSTRPRDPDPQRALEGNESLNGRVTGHRLQSETTLVRAPQGFDNRSTP